MNRKSFPLAVLPPLLLLLAYVFQIPQSHAFQARIDPEIQDALQNSGMISIAVAIEGRLDRRGPSGMNVDQAGREERMAFVSELKAFHRGKQSRVMGLLRSLEARGLVSDVKPLWIANIITLKASSEAVSALAEADDVVSISAQVPQSVLGPPAEYGLSTTGVTWGVAALQADRVWNELGYHGDGVLIAMMDTGIDYYHSDLQNRIWNNPQEIPFNGVDDDGNGYIDDYYGFDFADGDADPMDDTGHGTVTAGLAAGDGTAGTSTGVAPGASLMVCKVLTNGMGIESTSWEAVQYAVEKGADIINLSIGWIQCVHNPSRGMWRLVLENAMDAGVVVCAAAGNEGNLEGQALYCPPPYNIRTPGDVPGVITAGAIREDYSVPLFSSRGPVTWQDESPYYDHPYPPGLSKPDICTPGARVNSTILGGGYSGDYWSGTSTSSAYLAGAAALLLEKNPSAPPHLVKQYMLDNAIPLSADPDRTGAGRLDVYEAILALPSTTDDTPPGTIVDLTGVPGPAADAVTLRWTAPGDDGSEGTASLYEVRYVQSAAGPIADEAAWEGAVTVAGAPTPSAAGTLEVMTISGLASGQYYFAVRALDDFLNISGISNSPSCATGSVDLFAVSQTTDFGSIVSGDLADLVASDNSYLILEEKELEDGPPPKRHDELIHTWTFNVPAWASIVTLNIEACHSFTLDYEDFDLSFSQNGVDFTYLLTISKTADDDQEQTITLPPGVSGDIQIRVQDTDRTKRNVRLNRLYVDRLYINACVAADSNPPVFFGLENATDTAEGGSIELSWSEAFDPEGSIPITYSVYEATQPGVEFDAPVHTTTGTSWEATGLTDGVAYYYVVRASDAYGNQDDNTVELCATPSVPLVCEFYIQGINLKLTPTGTDCKAGAAARVVTMAGDPVVGAQVYATWYLNGVFLDATSAATGLSGTANLQTPLVDVADGDVFRFVVTNVISVGCTYNPAANVETEDSIEVDFALYVQDSGLPSDGPPSPAILKAPRSVGTGSFTFELILERELDLSVAIYDASGRLVRRVADGIVGQGPHRIVWDGATSTGRRAAAGVYYYSVKAGPLSRKGKIILVR